jgi:hypothetical protein
MTPPARAAESARPLFPFDEIGIVLADAIFAMNLKIVK